MGEGDPTTIVEGHPEVCFRAFAGQELQYNKRTAPGLHERLEALERSTDYERGAWRGLAASLAQAGHGTGTDDLVDALGLAFTARTSVEELQRLPPDPPRDAEGLPMQMVYRRADPFDLG